MNDRSAASLRAASSAAVQATALRTRLFPLLWSAIWPVRVYLVRSPISRGKGFITRRFLMPLLPPPPNEFPVKLAGGGEVMVRYREVIGMSALLRGGFETAETDVLRRCARPGTVAIDVGANVGFFTTNLARAVGPQGTVLAFEPLPLNADRLKANVERNGLGNVEVHVVALGNRDGTATLRLSDDPAYCSTAVRQNRPNGRTMTVPLARLDRIWNARGQSGVSVMKIDVEGDELAVLEGAEQLVATCRPPLLIEADSPERLESLTGRLSRLGYAHAQPAGFMPWNHLFLPDSSKP